MSESDMQQSTEEAVLVPEMETTSPENVIETAPDILDNSSEDESSKKVGKILSAERQRLRSQHAAEISELKKELENVKQTIRGAAPVADSNYYGGDTIFDPLSNQNVLVDSIQGQLVLREQLAQQQRVQQQQKAKEHEVLQKIETFQEEAAIAETKYTNFSVSRRAVHAIASNEMSEALLNTDVSTAIINFLGTNQKELERFKLLTPVQQVKEVYKLEERLLSRSKTVSQAAKPFQTVSGNQQSGSDDKTKSRNDFESYVEAIKQRKYGGST